MTTITTATAAAPPIDPSSLLEALLTRVAQRVGDDHGLAADDAGGLVHLERLPARAARTAELDTPLPPAVWDRLGIGELWSHQAEALDLARAGHSVVIATPTASGKSLVYQALVGEAALDTLTPATALALFPTKALAQDQLRALTNLDFPRITAAVYDGDCGTEERAWVRRRANVVLTNPDMLHSGILPHHGRWATFLRNLRYVVVDELHVLRGIFGSHVAQVLRRLRRLCAHYGSNPVFVFSSATIGRPGELAAALCGLPVMEVTNDGSPRGDRLFALWNPPLLDRDTGARASTNSQAAELVAELVHDGHRTIAFCRSRKGTEIITADVRRRLPAVLCGQVRSYRAGYLASERREIEAELFGGSLRGVVATTALELGIDVGGLDACVLTGFPGTISSMWQQAGRAGRDRQTSLAVLVAGTDQLDQWLMTHPVEVFTRPPEPAVVNPTNSFVLDPHIACAAYELALTPDDVRWWGPALDEAVTRLVGDDRLHIRFGGVGAVPPCPGARPVRAVWAGRTGPARDVGLRSGSTVEYRIALDDGTLIGTIDEARAYEAVHPGAIYLHQGQTYRVHELDLDEHVAIVEGTHDGESTQPRTDTTIGVLGCDRARAAGRAAVSLGTVEVESVVVGYQRRDTFTGDVISTEPLDLPPTRLVTRGVWYTIDANVVAAAGLTADRVPGALHAVEHAAIGVLPLFAICDRWDVGGVSTARLADTGQPTIVVYDGYPGGAGIAELAFEVANRHLATTLEVIEACSCVSGCPSCVQSPKCGNGNEPLDKAGAAALLRTILS